MYYAHEVEVGTKCTTAGETVLITPSDTVDAVNMHHARKIRNHWTHIRDSPRGRGLDQYREGGNCNFLALTVQARLVKYVHAKSRSNPQLMQKPGRPLPDYALRPLRNTPIDMPFHSSREEASIDVAMVEMLLSHGADPNQPVHLNDGLSVRALFLISIYEAVKYENPTRQVNQFLKDA